MCKFFLSFIELFIISQWFRDILTGGNYIYFVLLLIFETFLWGIYFKPAILSHQQVSFFAKFLESSTYYPVRKIGQGR